MTVERSGLLFVHSFAGAPVSNCREGRYRSISEGAAAVWLRAEPMLLAATGPVRRPSGSPGCLASRAPETLSRCGFGALGAR